MKSSFTNESSWQREFPFLLLTELEMSNYKVGEEVWFRDKPTDAPRRGILISWSTHHEEFESGPGHYPAAVIHDVESHSVKVVFAELVTFM